ncbi:uncharacterized protein BT62DRAFT_708316 [Guyanagaster necrorhizus]|uniref:Uncharacterized protein n=1 Tax=Guyanagaster necrorhizus TaxID=856835 RepID=A0A9P7VXD5_9AGAR|nr:uncharacterized protein BT62DRAFT_708316 [Guyanagaster necrorhizus MCA 3950]KAG7448480.1 hypothetical protein BT62DRAFT_708316 [Guyanagaster necrorhizus MCA 3950]
MDDIQLSNLAYAINVYSYFFASLIFESSSSSSIIRQFMECTRRTDFILLLIIKHDRILRIRRNWQSSNVTLIRVREVAE